MKSLDITSNSSYYEKFNNYYLRENIVSWVTTQSAEGIGSLSSVEDVLKYGSANQKATLASMFDGSYDFGPR